jgi:hypothetical protein
MKKILYPMVAVALIIAATLIAKTQTVTFTANNNYSGSVGTITINDGVGPTYLNVPSSGQFQTYTTTAPINVVINGQTIYGGVSGSVTLPNSDKITVTWSGPSIIVIDPSETN